MIKTSRADRRKNIHTYKHWVYGLYLNNQLCYVGVTADPAKRVVEHEKRKHFDEMRLVKGFSNREVAEDFEKFAINYFNPPLNILKLESNAKKLMGMKADELGRFEDDSKTEDFPFYLLTNKTIERRRKYEAQICQT